MKIAIVLFLTLIFSVSVFAAKPPAGAKDCRKKIQAQIKELRAQAKLCKGAPPIPEPEPELPEEPLAK
jgi:hypothetical protein